MKLSSQSRFVLGAIAAGVLVACSGATSSTEVVGETAAPLRALTSDEVIGPIGVGETTAPLRHPGLGKYRAYRAALRPGASYEAWFRSEDGDALGFVSDTRWKTLDRNDDANESTRDARVTFTVPRDGVVYLVFRERDDEPATFTVSLRALSPEDSDAGAGEAGADDAGTGDAGTGEAGTGDAGTGEAGPGTGGPGDAQPGEDPPAFGEVEVIFTDRAPEGWTDLALWGRFSSRPDSASACTTRPVEGCEEVVCARPPALEPSVSVAPDLMVLLNEGNPNALRPLLSAPLRGPYYFGNVGVRTDDPALSGNRLFVALAGTLAPVPVPAPVAALAPTEIRAGEPFSVPVTVEPGRWDRVSVTVTTDRRPGIGYRCDVRPETRSAFFPSIATAGLEGDTIAILAQTQIGTPGVTAKNLNAKITTYRNGVASKALVR